MGTGKAEIKGWFQMGVLSGHSHMIVVCDQMDWEDYPVFTNTKDETTEKITEYANPTSALKIMEVYDLGMDMDAQLDEHRAYHV